MPVISIIIPVYKVERYITECLESVVKQLNEKIEVILVDDGSPDNSGRICDEFAAKYSEIRVIHKENGGVSSARNMGIVESKGEYIIFLDSDDLLAENHLEDVLLEIGKLDCGLYTFGYEKIDEQNVVFENRGANVDTAEYDKEIFYTIYYKNVNEFPWNIWQSAYKANIIKDNNIVFPVGKKAAEDIDFYLEYVKYIDKISYINKNAIKYRVSREGSATTDLKLEAMLGILDTCEKHFYKGDSKLRNHVSNLYVAYLNMIIRLKKEEEKQKIIDMLDKKIIMKATKPKYVIFKVIYCILGKKLTMKLLLNVQAKKAQSIKQ